MSRTRTATNSRLIRRIRSNVGSVTSHIFPAGSTAKRPPKRPPGTDFLNGNSLSPQPKTSSFVANSSSRTPSSPQRGSIGAAKPIQARRPLSFVAAQNPMKLWRGSRGNVFRVCPTPLLERPDLLLHPRVGHRCRATTDGVLPLFVDCDVLRKRAHPSFP